MVKIIYLVAAVLFILGLKLMARPRTAVRGNLFGALGMVLAVLVTFQAVSGQSLVMIMLGRNRREFTLPIKKAVKERTFQ